MKSNIPKQFLELAGKPILMHTIKRFSDIFSKNNIILVLPEKHMNYWKKLCIKHNFKINHSIVFGGENRFESVKNGLKLACEKGVVFIHDGVRPIVDKKIITNCLEYTLKYNCAIPYVKIDDSLRKVFNDENKKIERDGVIRVQTPQCFNVDLIKEAYMQPYNKAFTDDASVFESCGHNIYLVNGNKKNIKITTKEDIKIAEVFLKLK